MCKRRLAARAGDGQRKVPAPHLPWCGPAARAMFGVPRAVCDSRVPVRHSLYRPVLCGPEGARVKYKQTLTSHTPCSVWLRDFCGQLCRSRICSAASTMTHARAPFSPQRVNPAVEPCSFTASPSSYVARLGACTNAHGRAAAQVRCPAKKKAHTSAKDVYSCVNRAADAAATAAYAGAVVVEDNEELVPMGVYPRVVLCGECIEAERKAFSALRQAEDPYWIAQIRQRYAKRPPPERPTIARVDGTGAMEKAKVCQGRRRSVQP